MNRHDAANVMMRIGSVHPTIQVTADMIESWYTADLISVDFDLGMQTAEFIVREDNQFPKPARFREVRRSIERGREPTVKALDEAPPTDAQRGNIQRVRATMRALHDAHAGQEHWHGGPGPCPIRLCPSNTAA